MLIMPKKVWIKMVTLLYRSRLTICFLICFSGVFSAVLEASAPPLDFDVEPHIAQTAIWIVHAEGEVEEKLKIFNEIASVIAEHKKLTPGRLTREKSRKNLMISVFSFLGQSDRKPYEKLYQKATHTIFRDLVECYSAQDLMIDWPAVLPLWLVIRYTKSYYIDGQEYDKAEVRALCLASKEVAKKELASKDKRVPIFSWPHPDEIFLDIAHKLAQAILKKIAI